MSKTIILDVPYYSQFSDEIEKEWQNQACGVVALKMVLDFYNQTVLNIQSLIQEGVQADGFVKDVGWVHSALIKIARQYGLLGWRKNFFLSPHDLTNLKEENYSQQEIDLQNKDLTEEGIVTLAKSIAGGNPVIVSVTRNFDAKKQGHLIVLTGIKDWNGGVGASGFFYNDPDNLASTRVGEGHNGQKNNFVSLQKFEKNWSRRAVFLRTN